MVGTSPPPGLCSFSTQRRCSVDVKTITELRISATKLDHRGWMSENYPSLQRREKCFLLTSPFIERCSVDVKTITELRISATKLDHRGWMSENYPSLQRREKCFLLTSPFIELRHRQACAASAPNDVVAWT